MSAGLVLLLAAVDFMPAGTAVVWHELRRGRWSSRAALAGDLLIAAGASCFAALLALGPLWPLACIPALAALGGTAAAVTVAGGLRRKAGRR